MASAAWTPATNGTAVGWSKNQSLTNLQATSVGFDDSATGFDSATVYFDGFNPTGTTPEGESGASWLEVAE